MLPSGAIDDKFFRFSVDLLCVIDFDGNFIRMSSAFLSQLGYLDSELVSISLIEFIHLDDRLKILEQFHSINQGQPTFDFECRFYCRDGSYKNLKWRGGTDPAQRLIYAIAREVKENKSYIHLYHEQEQDNCSILETVPICVFRADSGGNYNYINPVWTKVLGIKKEQAKGEGWAKTLHPEDRDRVFSEWTKAVQLGCSFCSEYRYIRLDGQIIWVLGQAAAHRDKHGRITEYVGALKDITALKQAETALKQMNAELDARVQQRTEELLKAQQIFQTSEEQFRQFSENLNQVFWMTDISKQVMLYISPAYEKVWGRFCESLYQNPSEWLTAIHPEDREQVQSLLPAQLSSEYDVEYRIIRPDGKIRWIYDRSFPIRNEAGEIYRIAGIAEDISDRKEAELSLFKMNEELEKRVEQRTLDLKIAKEAAEEASKAKSVFLVNMNHELRTPLNAILGFSQLLLADTTLNSDQKENLRIIKRSGTHLRTLINDILDISKIEVGRINLVAKDCNLKQMLTDLKEIFSLKAKEKCLSFKFEQDLTVPRYIHADEIKLRQVLFNLLGNALKFTQKGQVVLRVQVESEPLESKSSLPQSKLVFAIEDTGIGIAPEEIDTIFQPFVQTRVGQNFPGGIGLGLPISQAFVQLMGGTISVTSEPEKGSCFQFIIPVKVILTEGDIEPKGSPSILALQPNQKTFQLLVAGDQDPNAPFTQCIQGLPQLLLKDLYQATLECDAEEMTLLIRAIQESSPQLFNHLTTLINKFRFDDVVALIKPWIEDS
jgi:two-component system sensor histidine kinase/response regulator